MSTEQDTSTGGGGSEGRPAIVVADRLAKHWPDGGGLRPVSFALHDGELTVVRGRSGSGKSTLLSILAGWSQPDAGTVTWRADVDPNRWDGVATVPQALGLFHELTLADNVELPLRTSSPISRADRMRQVDDVLGQLAIGDLGDRLPNEVSMGQQQRAAIARAIIAAATVVLVDEPTSHQDPANTERCLDALTAARGRGAALLIASHDPAVIDRADLVIDLDDT